MADESKLNGANGLVWLEGRVDSVRRSGDDFFTILILPAADAFASPSWVEVRGSRAVGSVGSDARCQVRVGGFRGKSWRDDRTGEQRRFINMRLDLV